MTKSKKLYRCPNDKLIAGICCGIGDSFGIDVGIVRLTTVFACILTGIWPLALTYLAGWFILPLKEDATAADAPPEDTSGS